MIFCCEIVGLCDNIILDARGTTNLGGKTANFSWQLINVYHANGSEIYINQIKQGNYVVWSEVK